MYTLRNKILKFKKTFLGISRVLLKKFKYQSQISIDFNTEIGKKCIIKSTRGSFLKLQNCKIGGGATIICDHGGKLSIFNSFLGMNCMVVARSSIIIKQNCQIAEMVVIRDQNHNFGAPGKTIAEQGFTTAPIIIEENVWLGAKVTVLAGSHIGKNTVVGANSVVRGKLDANSVYAGVPVRKIRSF